ncbi:MAG: hypothetical protein IPI97_11230 [Nitrosomonas sp.]|mgnify:CR=1 FL=1|nr:hypothetical protein [Nitrosomonas sp.]MBK7365532.1 hypothetical protein [Nitrosomonas sp.]
MMIEARSKSILLIILAFLISGLFSEVNATHISKPILSGARTEYTQGEKIVVSGWVNYQDQPTSDVLLNAKLLRADGAEVVETFNISDKQGKFSFEFEANRLLPGSYQIIITSQCLEVHRPVCTYQSTTLAIDVKK